MPDDLVRRGKWIVSDLDERPPEGTFDGAVIRAESAEAAAVIWAEGRLLWESPLSVWVRGRRPGWSWVRFELEGRPLVEWTARPRPRR